MNNRLFDYIEAGVTPYQAIANTAEMLRENGCTELTESAAWNLEAGKGYYVTRNGSSLIAFRMPEAEFSGFMMTAAHCDSPCLKIKEHAELAGGGYVQLSTEEYGGMICSSWFDRPLSVAGRVLVRTEAGVEQRLVDLREPTLIIPNVAIHMNRKVNDGMAYNFAVDMLPLYGLEDAAGTFRARIAKAADIAEEALLATDLFVYNPQKGVSWGGMISAPRLDDLQCAFSGLTAFCEAKSVENLPVYCLFDNEEVGSRTKQGAASTFLRDVLNRIGEELGMTKAAWCRAVANSFLVSCDNAHACHPNHPEYSDKNHKVFMNQGVVVKYNANQSYTSDAVSAALFGEVCRKAEVPVQMFANRADMRGGSTLGNIANTQVSLNSVDIGLPQLAMHSSYETAGAEDTVHMVRALTAFYETVLTMEQDGVYTLR